MKRLFSFLVLLVVSFAAFALPSPKQIEDALAARDYVTARGMVQEALRERPDSARAHLLNAYLLEHVDHSLAAARAELQTAAGLDKKGDVKSSALFGRVVAEMDAQAASVPVQTQKVAAAPSGMSAAAVHEASTRWAARNIILIVAIVAVVVICVCILMRPRREAVAYGRRGDGFAGGAESGPTTLLPGGGPTRAFYTPPPMAPVQAAQPVQPAQTGMTMGQNFAATAGGVVAGNVISDMLLHRHSHDDSAERRRRDESSQGDTSYVPTLASAPAVDSGSERASFSSSSSGSDSWGSSDIGYSSSSSSDSGWSGSDSGSSGSSDW